MTAKKIIIPIVVAIINTLVAFLVPIYGYVLLEILFVLAILFPGIIVIDILGKSRLWIGYLYCLVLAIASDLIGLTVADVYR